MAAIRSYIEFGVAVTALVLVGDVHPLSIRLSLLSSLLGMQFISLQASRGLGTFDRLSKVRLFYSAISVGALDIQRTFGCAKRASLQ